MKFTEENISALRESVKRYMSEKRYIHTLGVEEAAMFIGGYCMRDKIPELRCAALLHDISKELSESEQLKLVMLSDKVTEDDLLTPPAYHAFTADKVISRDFPEYATQEILSAVFHHTTLGKEATDFDKIIFIADYVEASRTYDECIRVREMLYEGLKASKNAEECILWLNKAVIRSLENTIASLSARGRAINPRTKDAKEYLMKQISEN